MSSLIKTGLTEGLLKDEEFLPDIEEKEIKHQTKLDATLVVS